jgi:hypothetical protein
MRGLEVSFFENSGNSSVFFLEMHAPSPLYSKVLKANYDVSKSPDVFENRGDFAYGNFRSSAK